MWVAPDARGLGLAQRMLEALEGHAASMGLHTLRLDTNRSLAEARALYLRNGYREVAPYNDNPYADHWFQKDRSEEHTSELQSLMRTSYAVFCLKKKTDKVLRS